MTKKIILFSGDPNSINSEIIYKTWKKISSKQKENTFIISNFNLLKDQFKKLNYKINPILIENIFKSKNSKKMKIINIDLKYKNSFKVPVNSSSKYIFKSLNLAHNLALNKKVAGIINCPINKIIFGSNKIGVTEFLASKCSVRNNAEVMVIGNEKLMVSPVTTHLDLKSVSKKLNKKLIVSKISTLNNWYVKFFKKKPKIAILGLNPHNAEYRNNSEEKLIIIPAIKKLRKQGISLKGPFAADTIFINEYKKFNVIIGMYHDQVLTPFKTLFKFNAINITLGLKYTRVSPDHGVAINKILKKKSNPSSLLKCFKFISKSIK